MNCGEQGRLKSYSEDTYYANVKRTLNTTRIMPIPIDLALYMSNPGCVSKSAAEKYEAT